MEMRTGGGVDTTADLLENGSRKKNQNAASRPENKNVSQGAPPWDGKKTTKDGDEKEIIGRIKETVCLTKKCKVCQ